MKGAANFEKKTFTEVTEARARVGQVTGGELSKVLEDPATFQRFQAGADEPGLGALAGCSR